MDIGDDIGFIYEIVKEQLEEYQVIYIFMRQ